MSKFFPKHKYGAERVQIDQIKFPSKLEGACYQNLKFCKSNERIQFFLMQVPFSLPGGAKHVVDFCIFTKNTVLFVEAKGRDLPVGKLKRQQVEDLFNINIHVVKKADEIYKVLDEFGNPHEY
jgi:hypothetical protein